MENFGERVSTLRRELGLGQKAADAVGISQPRLSKIERGNLVASAEIIDKLATVFGRSGLDLVRGTDREDHYRTQRISPEMQAHEEASRQFKAGLAVIALSLLYDRVCDLFEALYGGMAFPGVRVEGFYIELCRSVRKAAEQVEEIAPGITAELYLPDNLEPEGPDDDHLLAYGDIETEFFTKSRHKLLRLESEFAHGIDSESRDALKGAMNLERVDKQIEELRELRKDSDKKLSAHFEKMATKWRRENPPTPNREHSGAAGAP